MRRCARCHGRLGRLSKLHIFVHLIRTFFNWFALYKLTLAFYFHSFEMIIFSSMCEWAQRCAHRPICLSFVSFFRFCLSLCFLDCFGFVYLSEIIEKIYMRHTNTRKTKIYQYQHFEWVEKSRHTHTRTRWHINSTIPTSLVLMNANE